MTQMFLSRFRSQVGQQLQTVVFVVGIVVMGMGNSAMAQERLLRTLTVSGSGVERIATTMSQIQLGVEIQGKTAQEVQEELARRSSAVVELLRSRNVEKSGEKHLGFSLS